MQVGPSLWLPLISLGELNLCWLFLFASWDPLALQGEVSLPLGVTTNLFSFDQHKDLTSP